ncbi:hypothetical protein EAI30_10380 [Romboutsia ilealis]|uniref:Uncharacterized protein n=1 Tax=Romboutsia faecis TaxID=2764597 RepID=A0ABR7JP18_9FIRM|nr:hypothetical protein [Romboutsia faecis]MBC5996336.1 hypothetical protein [Romboutsia faecis]MRN25023.1 hypothetical protein [Romboutsia ilealis]
MLVDSIKVNVNKKDAMKKIFTKTPLISKIIQFNNKAQDIHLEYIEFKVLTYQIISKKGSINFFRNNSKTFNITMIVNTYSGYSESVDDAPNTVKRYIPKSCIKKSKVDEYQIIEEVKNQIFKFLGKKYKSDLLENMNIQNIKLIEVKSIYKPYWVANYNGKNIFVDA